MSARDQHTTTARDRHVTNADDMPPTEAFKGAARKTRWHDAATTLLIAWCLAGLGACSVVPVRPYQEVVEWPLTLPQVARRPAPAHAPVLLLRNVAAAPGLEERGLLTLRPDGSQFLDLYQEWTVAPAEGVTEALLNRLVASGEYAAVLSPGSRARADLVLEATLTAFVAEPGRARASLAITLVNSSGSVLLQTVRTATAPLASEQPAAKVTALKAALASTIGEVVQALQ